MNLKRVELQHKRYTLDEWVNGIIISEEYPSKKFIPYLLQGEIGALLSPDRSKVIEVRMGTDPENKQKFSDGLLLGNQDQPDICVKQYPSKISFPTLGNENQIYIDQSTNTIYRWDDTDLKYYECSSSSGDSSWKNIDIIDGGDCQNNPSIQD